MAMVTSMAMSPDVAERRASRRTAPAASWRASGESLAAKGTVVRAVPIRMAGPTATGDVATCAR